MSTIPQDYPPQYPPGDHQAIGALYTKHVYCMTAEGLHAKSAIAYQLARRDADIERLTAELEAMRNIAYDRAKEAVIAWSVCHSVHQKYCKGRDPFYTTRAADFARDEAAARAAAAALAQDVAELSPQPALPGDPV